MQAISSLSVFPRPMPDLRRLQIPAIILIFRLMATIPSHAQIPPPSPPNPAEQAAPRNDWMVKTESYTTKAAKGGIEILFLGDSITEGWGSAGYPVWKERFEPLKAANFGIGGDRTENVLWRIQHGNLDGIEPKVIVLLIGTNNTSRDSAPQIAGGIEAVVRAIRARTPRSKILLMAVFPRGARAENNAVRDKLAEVNKLISALDDGKDILFLDINSNFLQPDGTFAPEMTTDTTHLTLRGYQVWAEAMDEKLKALLRRELEGGQPSSP